MTIFCFAFICFTFIQIFFVKFDYIYDYNCGLGEKKHTTIYILQMRNRQVSTGNHEKLKSPFKKKTKQTKKSNTTKIQSTLFNIVYCKKFPNKSA